MPSRAKKNRYKGIYYYLELPIKLDSEKIKLIKKELIAHIQFIFKTDEKVKLLSGVIYIGEKSFTLEEVRKKEFIYLRQEFENFLLRREEFKGQPIIKEVLFRWAARVGNKGTDIVFNREKGFKILSRGQKNLETEWVPFFEALV